MRNKRLRLLLITISFLVFITVFVVGCSANNSNDDPENDSNATDETTEVEEWKPQEPIKVGVQYSAGGSTDITARIVSKNAESELGQPVVIENISGGGGTIVHNRVAFADPDGYTLLLANVPNMLTDKHLIRGIDYDLDTFTPIIMVAADPILLIVSKGSEYDLALEDFVELVKERPGEVKFGNPGLWAINDFSREIIQHELGIEFQRIPYSGGADAVRALLAGEVDAITTFYGDARPHIEDDKFSVIAVANDERLTDYLPETPTFMEKGYDVIVTSWRVLIGPKNMPKNIVQYLHDGFKASLDNPVTQKELSDLGVNIKYMGPDELPSFLGEEYQNYLSVIERLELEPQ